MKSFDQLKNEALNLGTDARRALLVELLRAQENRTMNSMIPLDASHSEAIRKEKDERAMAAILLCAAGAALTAGTIVIAVKCRKKVKAEAEKAKQQLEQEKKEMIRKLAYVKGRH